MRKNMFNKKNIYSIRKLTIGVCSAMIGMGILGEVASASESEVITEKRVEEQEDSVSSKQSIESLPEKEANDVAAEKENSVSEEGAVTEKPVDENAPASEVPGEVVNRNAEEAEVTEGEVPTVDLGQEEFKAHEVIKYENVKVTPANNNRVDVSSDIDRIKDLEALTLYTEFKQLKDNPGFYNLFSVSSSGHTNDYLSFFVNANGVPGLDGKAGSNSGDLFYTNGYLYGTKTVAPKEWHALAVTLDPVSKQAKMYVNGVLSKVQALPSIRFIKNLDNPDRAQLGATYRGSNTTKFWSSDLDIRNFTVYNKALTEEEIAKRSQLFIRNQEEAAPKQDGLSEGIQLFKSGYVNGYNPENIGYYRIPAMLVTDKGTIIVGSDERQNTNGDWGNIDMVVKRSTNGGKTWSKTINILDLATNKKDTSTTNSAMAIDMALVQDPTTKRIFSIYDVFPQQQGVFGLPNQVEARHTEIDGEHYLNLYKEKEANPYTVRNEIVYDPQGNPTEYRVITEGRKAPYTELGDIYKGDEKIGNVYFMTNSDSPFRVAKMNFLWMSYSDDDGQTWSAPKDISPSLMEPWMKFHGVGPGSGIALHAGEHAGRLVVPTYTTNEEHHLNSQSSRLIYSDDNGQTWQLGKAVNDDRTLANGTTIHSSTFGVRNEQNTEATVVQIDNGDVLLFMRNLSGKVQMARSKDGGVTWENDITRFDDVNDVYVQMSATRTVQDGKEYIVLVNAEGSGRNNGKARVARVEQDGSLTWISHKDIQAGKFAYNSMKQISDKEFAVAYEHAQGNENDYNIMFKTFTWDYLVSTEENEPVNEIKNITELEDGGILVEFKLPVVAVDTPNLTLSNGSTALFVAQLDKKHFVYAIEETDLDASITGVEDGKVESISALPVQLSGSLRRPYQEDQPNNENAVIPPVDEIRFEEKYGSSIGEAFRNDQPNNTWVFVGGKNVQNDFSQTGGIRNYVGQFEEYIRWARKTNENDMQRFVINNGQSGKTVQDIEQQFGQFVETYDPKVVGYMLGEEDYLQGLEHIESYKTALKALIDKSLALKNNTGLVVIQTPHVVLDEKTNEKITNYTQAIKEVLASYYTSSEKNRIVLADHHYYTDRLDFKDSMLEEDKLTDKGQVEIARQLSYFTIKRTDGFPGANVNLDLKPVKQAEVYDKAIPVATYNEQTLNVTLPTVDGVSEWQYELYTENRVVKDKVSANQFAITSLPSEQYYELIVKSADGRVQLGVVSGELINGSQSEKATRVNEENQEIQDKLKNNRPLTWLFMGDSITHGAQWTHGYDSVPQLFEKYLKNDLGREQDVVINTGVAGATSVSTLQNIEQRLEKYSPDVVSVMLGTNDTQNVTPDQYKTNLQTIIDKAKAKNATVILRTPTPSSNIQLDNNLSPFIEKMKEVAQENNVLLVDQYTMYKYILDTNPYLWKAENAYITDGVHSGANGQAYLNSLLIEAIGNLANESRVGNLVYQIDEKEDYYHYKPEFTIENNQLKIDVETLKQALNLPISEVSVLIQKEGSQKVIELTGVDGTLVSEQLDDNSDYKVIVKAKETNQPLTHILETNRFTFADTLKPAQVDVNELIDEALTRQPSLLSDESYEPVSLNRYKTALAKLLLAKEDQLLQEEVDGLIDEVYAAKDALEKQKESLSAGDFASPSAAAQNAAADIMKALDDLPETMWHSPWSGNFANGIVTLPLAQPVRIKQFDYVPRQIGSNGRFKSGILKVTDSNGTVHEYTFDNWEDTTSTKSIVFDKVIDATKLEIVMKESHANSNNEKNKYGSAVEFRVVPEFIPPIVLDETAYQQALSKAKQQAKKQEKVAKVEALHEQLQKQNLLTEEVLNALIERLTTNKGDSLDRTAYEQALKDVRYINNEQSKEKVKEIKQAVADLENTNQLQQADLDNYTELLNALREKAVGPVNITDDDSKLGKKETIPFETKVIETHKLPKGERKVVQQGKNGLKLTIQKSPEDKTEETITLVEPVEEIVYVGVEKRTSVGPGNLEHREPALGEYAPIPFKKKVVFNPKLKKGTKRVIQKGQDGLQLTIPESLQHNTQKQVVVIKEPVEEIVEIGTKRLGSFPSGSSNTGQPSGTPSQETTKQSFSNKKQTTGVEKENAAREDNRTLPKTSVATSHPIFDATSLAILASVGIAAVEGDKKRKKQQ